MCERTYLGWCNHIYKSENDHGLLLTSDVLRSRDEISIARDDRAQDDNSLYNKIHF